PGVVIVDFNSAIVLEERNPPPGLVRIFIWIIMSIMETLFLCDPYQSPRVRGAGITFTRPRERIRGVVDLRKQFRMVTKVPCYTREGIELRSNIFSVFTIGQDPDILEITFDGTHRPENLRLVTFERSQVSKDRFRVTSLNNDLDEADRAEIFHFARVMYRIDPMGSYTDLPQRFQQVYNSDRVFAAVSGEAHDNNQAVLPWTDLPARVAADLYRELLSQLNFDELYQTENGGQLSMIQYRNKLRRTMRNNGVLAFRMVQVESGEPLAVGGEFSRSDLNVSQIHELTNPKVLRDRGIKVIFSSFGDPIPVNAAIYQQRLDSWRACWDRELDITQATRELQAMRVSSRAYVETQKELWYSLSQLFEQNEYTDEALALRVLQALEKAANDPKTRALLPANTIDLMRDIRMLLMPGDFMFPVR
ncbi:MAG: hypothetical protein IH586_18640, partial [Anaerolineaceae bacterium]|nr:hypothetical protein [Anaerolineaceae bacterium]